MRCILESSKLNCNILKPLKIEVRGVISFGVQDLNGNMMRLLTPHESEK